MLRALFQTLLRKKQTEQQLDDELAEMCIRDSGCAGWTQPQVSPIWAPFGATTWKH